jgi:hypothetical protein
VHVPVTAAARSCGTGCWRGACLHSTAQHSTAQHDSRTRTQHTPSVHGMSQSVSQVCYMGVCLPRTISYQPVATGDTNSTCPPLSDRDDRSPTRACTQHPAQCSQTNAVGCLFISQNGIMQPAKPAYCSHDLPSCGGRCKHIKSGCKIRVASPLGSAVVGADVRSTMAVTGGKQAAAAAVLLTACRLYVPSGRNEVHHTPLHCSHRLRIQRLVTQDGHTWSQTRHTFSHPHVPYRKGSSTSLATSFTVQ